MDSHSHQNHKTSKPMQERKGGRADGGRNHRLSLVVVVVVVAVPRPWEM